MRPPDSKRSVRRMLQPMTVYSAAQRLGTAVQPARCCTTIAGITGSAALAPKYLHSSSLLNAIRGMNSFIVPSLGLKLQLVAHAFQLRVELHGANATKSAQSLSFSTGYFLAANGDSKRQTKCLSTNTICSAAVTSRGTVWAAPIAWVHST